MLSVFEKNLDSVASNTRHVQTLELSVLILKMQEQKLDQIALWIFWKSVEVQVLVEVRF